MMRFASSEVPVYARGTHWVPGRTEPHEVAGDYGTLLRAASSDMNDNARTPGHGWEEEMARERQIWGLVLAAGDGNRLRALTTSACGAAVPKQFCSLHGGPALIEDALDRAAALVDQQRICTIVAHHHRQWWSEIERVRRLQPGNVIVQPRNCGTAIGVLYSLLHIVAKDADAFLALLPADHYVRDEQTLLRSLDAALGRLRQDASRPVLLGMEPDESDTDLGYILPGEPDALGGQSVMRFVEKPDLSAATEIINQGGLWNSFIIAASAQSLLELFLPRYAPIVMEMQVILSRALAADSLTVGWPTVVEMYQRLPNLDFSRDVLEGVEKRLCVVRVPPCGWSDLGTPRRVGQTLRRLRPRRGAEEPPTPYINLAAQHARYAERFAVHG
jgi:mannose-1-phosphate guanylyltransferase